nr:uncharacterized protein LOC123757937 isoform X1 [Procambarus clarkii]XP_045597871.1 uncharacterized protein LOC123757937 isoform X1 [Procambarus clarkii]XP_045597881.1 uncharacterized protein LOC123757937 isoform X1 [Procambarus clarkii]XP_045597891.1 uncharacterized protein LOC123757937 isoform X1 [Procambarus clarkii]XP_045597900.1 uncharacterized protein LOC123757937 isoform X1 [Procambarus clarkii]
MLPESGRMLCVEAEASCEGGGWVESTHEDSSIKKGEGGPIKPCSRPPRPDNLVPPDGGWGWVIVAANCIITFVMGNIATGFSVLYVHLINAGYSNVEVSGIPALFMGLTCVLAPLSAGLSHFYSYRCLATVGVTITSLAILLCSFNRSLIWFYICFGGLAGFGNALLMPQGFLIGQKYFSYKKVTANALSMLGGSLGFMAMPTLLSYLVEVYALEGAFMLWAGLLLHAFIGALLFQPVEWHMKLKRTAGFQSVNVEQNGGQSQSRSDILASKIVVAGKTDDQNVVNAYEDDSVIKHLASERDESDESDHEDMHITQDLALCNSVKSDLSDALNLCNARQWKNPLTDTLQTNEYLERPRTVSIERSMEILPQIPEESEDEDCFETYDQEIGNERIEFLNRENEVRNRPVSFISSKSVDSFITAPSSESIFDYDDIIYQFGSALSLKTEKLKDRLHVERERTQKCNFYISNISSTQSHKPFVICGLKFPKLFDMINLHILRHPVFLIAAFSIMVSRMVYMSFVNYLPSLSIEVGVGRQTPYLYIIIATFELAAKIISSLICDQGVMQRRYFAIIASVNSVLANLTITFAWNFLTLGACCAWYGFSVGTCMSVEPVLLVEHLGLKLLPHSFGLMLFINGIGGLLLFPLTGWLSDVAGNYVITYYFIGGISLVPGLLWTSVPCFTKLIDIPSKSPTDNV